MPNHLTREVTSKIVDYLRDKPSMPHVVASYELEQRGIKVTVNTIARIRDKYELKYVQDKSTHKQVLDLYKNGIDINANMLREKFPHICNEHIEYLVRQYSKKKKISKNNIKYEVSESEGQVFKFKNVIAHVAHKDFYSFVDDENEPVRVNTMQHAVSQLMQKCA